MDRATPKPAPSVDNQRQAGLVYAVLAILVISPDALLIRLIDAEPWTFIFWRGLALALGTGALIFVMNGRRALALWRAAGRTGLMIAVVYAGMTICFQWSIQTTAVANTLVLISTAPLFAAMFAFLILRERIDLATFAAIVVSFGGVMIVVGGGVSARNLEIGDVLAVGASAALGLYFVLLRRASNIDSLPWIVVAGFLVTASATVMTSDYAITARQAGLFLVLGAVLLPLSAYLLMQAARRAPAPDVGLVVLLETLLGPLWVWLVIAEEPPPRTLIGGSIILLTLLTHALIVVRRDRQRRFHQQDDRD